MIFRLRALRRMTATARRSSTAVIRRCWSGCGPRRRCSTSWRASRRRCTGLRLRSTARSGARPSSTANWNRSKGSARRRSARCCNISARWRRSARQTSRSCRRWSDLPGRRKSANFLKNSPRALDFARKGLSLSSRFLRNGAAFWLFPRGHARMAGKRLPVKGMLFYGRRLPDRFSRRG